MKPFRAFWNNDLNVFLKEQGIFPSDSDNRPDYAFGEFVWNTCENRIINVIKNNFINFAPQQEIDKIIKKIKEIE